MRSAGRLSGAWVGEADTGRALYSYRAGTARTLASNVKLFTTGAALARLGPDATLETSVMTSSTINANGHLRGRLYLRGGGDPTFGSAGFAQRSYLSNASVEALARQLKVRGLRRLTGRVVGDESRFDSLRGGPESRFGTSIYVGPLSALSFNRGLADERGSYFQSRPPLFAAYALERALERRGIAVSESAAVGPTPPAALELAEVRSPRMERIVAITNKRSDNLFAELLLKNLSASAGGRGTTAGGARQAENFASGLGARVDLADGSGLSRHNRAAPGEVGRFLAGLRDREEFPSLFESLPIAGRDGTLSGRMRGGPAQDRCRGKTGTLSNVSALSGYCRTQGGKTLVFSILMNGVNPTGARYLQDRMAEAIARYGG